MQPAERRVEIVTPPLSHTGSARPEASVTFTWTADDFVALAKQATVHAASAPKDGRVAKRKTSSPSSYSWIWLLIGILLVGLVVFVPVEVSHTVANLALQYFAGLMGTFTAILGILYLLQPINRRAIRRQLDQDKHLAAERTLTVSPDGVSVMTSVSTDSMKWEGIDGIDETDEHVFLWTGPRRALLIPKRAFADTGSCQAFVALARRYHKQSGGAPQWLMTPAELFPGQPSRPGSTGITNTSGTAPSDTP
ncbi:MAG TPA: YcxB family protein [Gemmataceae bacterium]|nr:YcxB family protein [Gemmataceae bacterium]